MFTVKKNLLACMRNICLPKNIDTAEIAQKDGLYVIYDCDVFYEIISRLCDNIDSKGNEIIWFLGDQAPFKTDNARNELVVYVWTLGVLSMTNAIAAIHEKAANLGRLTCKSTFESNQHVAINCFAWCARLGYDIDHKDYCGQKPLMFNGYPSKGFMVFSQSLTWLWKLNATKFELRDSSRLLFCKELIETMEQANDLFKNNTSQFDIGDEFLIQFHRQIDCYKDIYLFYMVVNKYFDHSTRLDDYSRTVDNMRFVIDYKLTHHPFESHFYNEWETAIDNINSSYSVRKLKPVERDWTLTSMIYSLWGAKKQTLQPISSETELMRVKKEEEQRFLYLGIKFKRREFLDHDPSSFIYQKFLRTTTTTTNKITNKK